MTPYNKWTWQKCIECSILQQHNIHSSTCSSSSWNFFQNITYFRSQSLNKYKKIEITLCILSDYYGIKLEFNNKRNCRTYSSTWRLNNTLLHAKWVTKEIREKIKKFLEFNENESTTYQSLWDTAKAIQGKVYSNECILKMQKVHK
jgi:hypothetical protein